jgi:hypothetical protein
MEFSMTENAIKDDSKKPKMHLLPSKVLMQVAGVLTMGAEKYSDYNYKKGEGLDHSRVINACLRHIMKYLDGEDINTEDPGNHHHLDCAMASLIMLKDLINEGIGKDDRYSTINKVTACKTENE